MFYVDTIDPNKTLREGIDAILIISIRILIIFPRKIQSELEQMIKGSYGGIGSMITYDVKPETFEFIAEPYAAYQPRWDCGRMIFWTLDGKDLEGKNQCRSGKCSGRQVGTTLFAGWKDRGKQTHWF